MPLPLAFQFHPVVLPRLGFSMRQGASHPGLGRRCRMAPNPRRLAVIAMQIPEMKLLHEL
jgi:hypothetical protein